MFKQGAGRPLFLRLEMVEVFLICTTGFVVQEGRFTLLPDPAIPTLPDRYLYAPITTVNGDAAVGLCPPSH